MKESRTNGSRNALLPATAASKRLGYFRVGSEQSRAAARALALAREESESEDDWDREPDCSGVAESLAASRKRVIEAAERGEGLELDLSPIAIPPGKENTIRGRLAARINDSRARLARLRDDVHAPQQSMDDLENSEG